MSSKQIYIVLYHNHEWILIHTKKTHLDATFRHIGFIRITGWFGDKSKELVFYGSTSIDAMITAHDIKSANSNHQLTICRRQSRLHSITLVPSGKPATSLDAIRTTGTTNLALNSMTLL